MTMITTDGAKKKRPRDTRYNGRAIREVLIPTERDEWVNRQMSAKWSRSQVIDQCIKVAMGKVDASWSKSRSGALTASSAGTTM